MGHIVSAAFPIMQGQASRVRDFEAELAPHREEWDHPSLAGTFRFYNVTLQEGPDGDLAIRTFEVEDPTKPRTSFTDSPTDRWWTNYLLEVHGIDVSAGYAPAPPSVFTWRPS